MTARPNIALNSMPPTPPPALLSALAASRTGSAQQLDLLVEGVHCANCIRKIETRLASDPAITRARVNLTLRRLSVEWVGGPDHAEVIGKTVRDLGYAVAPYDAGSLSASHHRTGRELLRCLAIAGFASSNVMMLAWAVWAGQAQGMSASTQAFFNWLSALVAVPALAVAGRPFYRSAFAALKAGLTNIDVPIVAALVLATAISLMELFRHNAHVYFDSASMLLFVLLIGRYLDFRVRARSREAIERLAMMRTEHAKILRADGQSAVVPAASVEPGMLVVVEAGETVPVDGRVVSGETTLDRSAVTGETLPEQVGPGDDVLAGSINGPTPLHIRAVKPVAESYLSEILRLVEQAQLQKGRAATMADRLAALWTPLVHVVAFLTLLGWWLIGADPPTALLHAVTVLIIACPCAIGLAIPAVQVAAIGGLLRRGILVRSGDALDRLATIDRVVVDKTGTLTDGRPDLVSIPADPAARHLAAALAWVSMHPFARAISRRLGRGTPVENPVETPGAGVSGFVDGEPARLGSAVFCGIQNEAADGASEVWVASRSNAPARFAFADKVRVDAIETLDHFRRVGLPISILSGDRISAVERCADELAIEDRRGGLKPAEKAALLTDWKVKGARPLMVGDGLNDAPALAAAHVSASFGHGVPATQVAADFVLPAETLSSMIVAHRTALKAAGIVRQNLIFAAAYNLALIPIAVLGLASPLIAAAAMSASSIVVTLNALRAQPPRIGTVR
ncbi:MULTISPECIES: cation-translocating P-type ATPase [unclassified Sinorhizobium]|uniref:heavy metal translocating P-type ATPase n=1 Tax=unclassified Sinorhizobium TaxID=2613772 RepID=UPI0024C31538|nr:MULTISPECIES: cation-translocating P-type ATPase [unclassified Sinorhizobium]MDK1376801.1 cation-translocating P-type ATPase [Sinorhizobium sp. 6-70]MDK1479573.1 cation-translocating P-type ATPase [Sinorhizobium sp. 6-117]